MLTVTPFLTFNDQAEEAVNFYVATFKNAKILSESRYGEGGPAPKGSLMTATFVLEGQEFTALNGGPHFTFAPGFSIMVSCETQEEVDALWEKLSAGGEKGPCGWLTDRFGISWQVIPTALGRLMQDENPQKAQAVMQAMLQMSKIDIAALQRAYDQA
ncbi:MAG TPA: VOC family protein [Caldilineaceae bacterium]|nr:VOC family protein [Caldilineaceae bacterium]